MNILKLPSITAILRRRVYGAALGAKPVMADVMVEELTTMCSGRVIIPSTRVREASGSNNINTIRTSKKLIIQVKLTVVKKTTNFIKKKQNGKDKNKDIFKKID